MENRKEKSGLSGGIEMKELLIASTAFSLFIICPRIAGVTNVIAGATSPGLDGSVSMLPEWVHIASSILFALLVVIAFARKYAAHRARIDVDVSASN